MIAVGEETQAYRSQFEQFEKVWDGRAKSWLHSVRNEALSRFAELGFPTTDMEDWRFTSVARLASTSFTLSGLEAPAASKDVVDRFSLGEWRRTEVVFVNGRYWREASSVRSLPKGAMVGSLGEALHTNGERLRSHLTRYANHRDHAFAALNTAFVHDGALVWLPKGCVVEEPIHLLFLADSPEPSVSHPRVLVIAEDNSQARIVESYCGRDGEVYFVNAVTEVHAGDNAALDFYKLQREGRDAFHVATIALHLSRSATVVHHSVSLGGALARNDIVSVLDGEGADCTLNGLYAVRGRQHVDHHTVIDHAKAHGSSRELYKGILDESARAVFNGRIIVRPHAQKTDSRQTNKNLLLSKDALVNTNPQLEINADDVKCTHGATIGQLDADALFYLRSRGIDPETARSLLVHGFVSDITQRIQIDCVRSEVERALALRLPEAES